LELNANNKKHPNQKIGKKKNAQDDKMDTRLIFGLLHEVKLQATPSLIKALDDKKLKLMRGQKRSKR